jgi:hypothetical protein
MTSITKHHPQELSSLRKNEGISTRIDNGMKDLTTMIHESPETLKYIKILFEGLSTWLELCKDVEKNPDLMNHINDQYNKFSKLIHHKNPVSPESSRVEIIKSVSSDPLLLNGGTKRGRELAALKAAAWAALPKEEQMRQREEYRNQGTIIRRHGETAIDLMAAGAMAFMLVMGIITLLHPVISRITSWVKNEDPHENKWDRFARLAREENRRKRKGGKGGKQSKKGRNQIRTQKRRRLIIS